MAQAVEVLTTLTRRWRDLPADSVQAAEARKHLQQQSNLIANLLAEAMELETGLTREEEPARQARDEANEEYKKYREQHHDAEVRLRKGKDLSEEDRNELKRLWRQASKLCHPDLVADDLKEEANRMMVQLNQAKQRGDVKAIRSLVARLQQGFEPMMASDRLNDLERIRKKMAQVREQIDTLVNELAELEKEESWLLVSSLSNMEAYFRPAGESAERGMRLARTSGERSAAGSRCLIIWRASTRWHAPAVGQLRRFQTDGSGISPPSLPGQPDKVIRLPARPAQQDGRLPPARCGQ